MRSLAEATRTFQVYLETRRRLSEYFEDAELTLLDSDVARARREMEIIWLESVART